MTSKSSRRWLDEHFSDTYVKQAQKAGLRSRAVFKLMEIAERDHLFKRGMTVIDLGAAPGGWSQWVANRVKPNGHVIAMDRLAMEPIVGVDFIQGDFTEDSVFQTLMERVATTKADWVLSDMAPNMSGNACIDSPRFMHLVELALDFSLKVLKDEGGLLVKVFQGEGLDELMVAFKHNFKSVAIRKPKASRGRSREIYILARLKKERDGQ